MYWLGGFLGAAFAWLLAEFTTVGHNVALWVWDQLLSVVDFAVSLVPAGTLTTLPSISTLPADILGVFGYIGGWEAMGIISTALILRIPLGYVLKA